MVTVPWCARLKLCHQDQSFVGAVVFPDGTVPDGDVVAGSPSNTSSTTRPDNENSVF
jgi:hypothetical protein